MDRIEALIALNMVSDIGSNRLKKLLVNLHSPEKIFTVSENELIAASGMSVLSARRICSFKAQALDRELKLIKKNNLQILTFEDSDYPVNLKEIYDPPIVLYVKGKFLQEDNFALGIVGSRQASFYGLESAEKFSRELSDLGLTIISGLARGIDTRAHLGALTNNGRTIAVIGSGFGNIYPSENLSLANKIADNNGAVISEFSFNTAPERENFPRRNRVISGLSLGVLVVEAAKNSGALITADFALEQGREVFALPGKIDSPNSTGTNELIKQGAKLVSTAEDIIFELKTELVYNLAAKNKEVVTCEVSLSKEEMYLYELISDKPIFWDELIEKTNFSLNRVSQAVLGLEMKKLIRQLPGKQLIRN